jgi:hypothetical protein
MAEPSIVLGLPTYNDGATAAAAASALRGPLERWPSARVVLADGGSRDTTRSSVRHSVPPERLTELNVDPGPAIGDLPYHGHVGRLRAFEALFTEARRVDADVCVVLDVANPATVADWIDRLVVPVLDEQYDFVAPHSPRRPHEGAMTKGIVYPLVRALYGQRMRQPAASEFGCSRRLVAHYLAQDYWTLEGGRTGIDLWLSTTALADGFRACEAEVGARPVTHPRAGVDLGTALVQVLGALFADLARRVSVWQRIRGSSPLPVVGPPAPPHDDGDAQTQHAAPLLEAFRLGSRELRDVWTWVLPPRTLVELRRLAAMPPDQCRFDDELWAGIVYDFAIGHAQQVLPREQLLRSFTPLYSGWLGCLLLETAASSSVEMEARLEGIGGAFETTKRHLIARWRWPERLR